MSDNNIRYLADFQRLALKPGDTLVISVDVFPLSRDIKESLKQEARDIFGNADLRVIVLDRHIKLGVIGAAD